MSRPTSFLSLGSHLTTCFTNLSSSILLIYFFQFCIYCSMFLLIFKRINSALMSSFQILSPSVVLALRVNTSLCILTLYQQILSDLSSSNLFLYMLLYALVFLFCKLLTLHCTSSLVFCCFSIHFYIIFHITSIQISLK